MIEKNYNLSEMTTEDLINALFYDFKISKEGIALAGGVSSITLKKITDRNKIRKSTMESVHKNLIAAYGSVLNAKKHIELEANRSYYISSVKTSLIALKNNLKKGKEINPNDIEKIIDKLDIFLSIK